MLAGILRIVPSAANSYADLSPAARLVAQAYGVVAPQPLRVARTRDLLAKAKVKLLDRALNARQIEQATDELTRAEMVVREKHSSLAAPQWALRLTRIAHQEGHLKSLLGAFEAIQAEQWYDPMEDTALLRGYLVAGDIVRLNDLIDDNLGSMDWSFLAEPPALDLLRQIPKSHLQDAFASCLDHVIRSAAPPQPIIDACHAMSPAPWEHAADIAFIRVLQGRFDAAEAVFAALPASNRNSKQAAAGLAATQALIALLKGDDEAARLHIGRTIAADKLGTRRRLVFPALRTFALALLALVRVDSPQARQELDDLLRTARRLDLRGMREIAFVENALRVKNNVGAFGHTPDSPCLEMLFDGLVSCWLDDFNPERKKRRGLLLPYRDRAVANGFAWAAAECDEVLRRYAMRHGGEAAEFRNGHAELGTVTLATLAAPVADWERSLKAIEQLAYKAGGKKPGKSDKADPKRRLTWELCGEHSNMVEVREQRQNKNGSWSKGRRLSAKRLIAEAAQLDFLLPQDRAAIAALSTQYWSSSPMFYPGNRSLHALAGHPHVYNRQGDAVEVVEREPELSIEEDDDGSVVVHLEPYRSEFDGDYIAEMVTERRCEVTRFKPEHERLLEAIPEDGLALPTGAKSRLLEAVAALASDIRVQSATADGAAGAMQIEADEEPWVRLEPLDAGLTVALVVEPIPDSGICFEPGAGGTTVFANREGDNVQTRRDLDAERLHAERLAAHCPPLASRPTELRPLILSEPLQCLELLEQLRAAQARCKWPKGEPFRIVAQASTASLSLTVKSAAEWLQASGKLAIDDQRVLDLKRLFALLEASPGSRFLELGGGEFLALTGTFRRQLDDLAALAAPAAQGAMKLHPLATLALDDLLADAEVESDKDWRDLQARLAAAESFEPTLPSTLQAELRPYQVEGFRWLVRLSRWGAGACLADDMGLGKTVQTLAVLLDRAPGGPALVVAPTSVVANWTDEARRFAPTLNVKHYTGPGAARAELLQAPGPFDLYLTTYGVLQNDVEQLAAVQWHSAVLDEAQAIKNPAAKRTRAARAVPADFRMITTGTPIQNNLVDLHSLFSFANPGLLGSLAQFRANFAAVIERDADMWAQGRLRRLIAPFVLRRLKADVLDDLPERTEIVLHVEMSAEEATLYEALRQRAVEELEAARQEGPDVREGARRVQVLAHLTRLRQACCNPRLVLDSKSAPRSSKLATFATTLEELLQNRHKVLVFSQFVKHLKLVEEYLQSAGVGYQYLDGSTPAKARTQRINAFQSGDGDVFLISLKAGGVGLNLTAADYVIHMDPWWNPAVEDQASDRAHRIGQTRPVTIYRLVTEGTIEEQIVDLHHRKRDLADQLLDGTDAPGRLNADELLDLLREPLGVVGRQ